MDLNTKAYELAKELKNNRLITLSSNGLCVTYDRLNNNELSIYYGKIALEAARKRKDTFSLSYILGNLSEFHYEEGNFNQSTIYNDEVINLAKKSNDCRLFAQGYQQHGMLQYAKNDLEQALSSFEKSMEQSDICNDEYLVSVNLFWKSKVQLEKNNYVLAKDLYDRSHSMLKKIGGEEFHLENPIVEFDILFNLGKKNEAVNTLLDGLARSRNSKQINNEVIYLNKLGTYYQDKKDFEKAYQYAEESKKLQDSISNFNKAISMLELERKYNLEKKDVEVQLLQEQKNKDAQIIKSRSYFIIAVTLFAMLVGAIAFFTWLSLKKEAKYNSQLEQEVYKRTEELQHSNEMLVNSNQELERFAYISSHDLKEPLKNINSFTKLIKKESQSSNNTKMTEYANILENCSIQLDTLVSDILDYSMVKSDLRIQNIDLNHIISQLKSDLDKSINISNATIDVDKLPTIKTDKSSIYRIFKNLIENGIKYNSNDNPNIKISVSENTDEVRLVFADNGIGIAKKYHEEIFTMFKRLHNKENYTGSGIGLSTVKAIIERLKGTIKVISEPNHGSKFIVTLPKLN